MTEEETKLYAARYKWLIESQRKRHGETMTGGHRLIMKNHLSALMDFSFWCTPQQLGEAIDKEMMKEEQK